MKNKQQSVYDLVVVGCGFTGSIIAYLAANRLKKRVLLLERRTHIAGNMYDEKDPATGILIQKYGPHGFHTENESVFRLMCEIGEWEPLMLTARAVIKGKMTPLPFNYQTVDDYFPPEKALEIKTHLAHYFEYRPKVTILEMMDGDDQVVREYAQFLFQEDYRPYTAKQWGIKPEELDVSILQRVPVRLNYDDKYFDDRYQMQPKGGYTVFFEKMLDSNLINIQLSVDAKKRLALQEGSTILLDGIELNVPVVYTGALDELLDCKFGKLPYRSLSFEYKRMSGSNFQPTTSVAHPMAEGYTRVTEFSKLMPMPPKAKETIIAYEYPEKYGIDKGKEPYYPILTEDSQALYSRYLEETAKYPLLFPCGRLGDFKYYNMDQAILRAQQLFETLPL